MFRKPASAVTVAGRLGATGGRGVDDAPLDQAGGVADGVRSRRRTRCRSSRSGPAGRSASRSAAPEALTIIIGTRKGEHAPLALLDADDHLLLERVQPTDAAGEDRAEPRRLDADRVEATGAVERLAGRGEGELLDTVGAARVLRVLEVRGRIPVVDLDGLASVGDPGPSRPAQNASAPMPAGATTPSPVTATRRSPLIRAWR